MTRIVLTILGEPASKANSRKIVTLNGHASSIKSEKARDFEREALKQIPPKLRVRLDCPLRVYLRIFYASERPDLDESIVLDVLQDRYKARNGPKDPATGEPTKIRELVQLGIYRNDRQVREKHVFWGLDKQNPRTEIVVEPLQWQQSSLVDDV